MLTQSACASSSAVSEIQPFTSDSSDDKSLDLIEKQLDLFLNDSTLDQTEDVAFDDAWFSPLDLHNADDFIDFNQNGPVTTMAPDSGNSSASADIWEGAHSTLDAPHSAHQPAASLPRAFSSSADAQQTAEGGIPGAFVATMAATECTDCEVAKYHATTGSECTDCAAGKVVESTAQTSCLHCPSGKYQDADVYPPAGCFGLPMTAMAGMGLPMDPVTFAAAQSRGMPAMPQFHQGSGQQSIYQPMSRMTEMMMQFNLMMHQMKMQFNLMGMYSPMLHGGLNRPARQARLMPKKETHVAGGGIELRTDAGLQFNLMMESNLRHTDADAGLNVTGRKHAAQDDLPKLIKRSRCA
jgi:hypothetical protein